MKLNQMLKRIEYLHETDKKTFNRLTDVALFIVFLLCLLLGFVSCSAPKNLVDNSQINRKDSVIETVKLVHDTIEKQVIIEKHDTLKLESQDNSQVNFVEGGGTYNVETGQMTGVQSLNLSKTYKETKAENERLQASIIQYSTELNTLKDSISVLNQKNEIKQKEGLNSGYQFIIKLGIILLIVYLLRIILKILAIKYPIIKPVTKFTDWLP